MIIDSPSLQAIAVGAGRVIPNSGDAQVIIPSTIVPVLQVMQPTSVFTSSNGNSGGSNFTSVNTSRNNQVGGTLSLQNVSKGLYEVECMMSVIFDYTLAVSALRGVEIRFFIGSSSQKGPLLWFFPFIGVQSGYSKFRILAQDTLSFELTFGTTGVAENIGLVASVNAVRIL